MFELYNEVKRDYIEIDYCQDGTTTNKIVRPIEYERDQITKVYSERQFLEFYMNIRIAEEKEISLTPHEVKELMRQCLQLARTRSPMDIVSMFESSIAATYNSSGSLTDAIYRVKVREEERVNVLSST